MKSRVRIGYQADFPPFMSGTDRPVGLVIEALAPGVDALQQAGTTVDWLPLPLADQEEALLDGRVDLLAGLGVTKARASTLVFGSPLVRTGGALFARHDSDRVRRIVTPAAGPLRDPTISAFPDCEVVDAVDYPDALAQVVAGCADAAALNLHVGRVLAEREHTGVFALPQELFVVVELAPAYRPDHDPDLRRLLDAHAAGPGDSIPERGLGRGRDR